MTAEKVIFELTKNPNKLLAYCLDKLEEDSCHYFKDYLSYLNENDLAVLIEKAIKIAKNPNSDFLKIDFDKKDRFVSHPIENLVAHISYQYPHLLHPYIKDIWQLKINHKSYYAYIAWRGLNKSDIEYFKALFLNSNDKDERKQLFLALIYTCDKEILKWLYDYCINNPDYIDCYLYSIKDYIEYCFWEVGFFVKDGEITSYIHYPVYHLIFPKNHLIKPVSDNPFFTNHPTYFDNDGFDNDGQTFEFGGILLDDDKNPFCKVIEFNPIPKTLNIKSLNRLTLACHFSELNSGYGVLFYRHDDNGMPVRIGDMADELDCLDSPYQPCQITLHQAHHRWEHQDWAVTNSRENLNRIGGMPSWVQSAYVPICPISGQKMRFLMQLDSNILTQNGVELYFGSGGMCYIFWCDDSRVSAFLIQCT